MKRIVGLLFAVFYTVFLMAQNVGTVPKTDYKITNLGPQLNDIALQGSVFAKTNDGKLLIYTVTRGTPAHLLGFNVATKALEVDLPLPKVDGSWDLEVSSTGIVYVAGGSGGYFYKHVPGSNKAENMGKVLGTENYIWDLAAGKNGEIYGATYPNCRVFKYHPDEGYTDFGVGALVKDENYVRGLVYNHSLQKIFAGIGSKAHLIELDMKTKSKTNVLAEKYHSAKFVYDIGQAEGLKTGDRIYLMLTGAPTKNTVVYNVTKKVYERDLPSITVKTIIKDPNSEKVYFVSNSKLMVLNYADENPMPEKIADFRGKPLASTWNSEGELVFLNSYQQIVTINTSSAKSASFTLKVPPQPIALTYIDMGPDKKIWSGGYLSGGHAAYDLTASQPKVYKGLSQTESATKLGSKIYFGNYPGSRFNVFDTSKEWNLKEGNPKFAGTVKGQDRPFGALAIPSLNKVYFGTVPDYGKHGGALVEIDANTDQVVHQEVNIVENQSVITLAFQNDMVVGGTSIWGGLGNQPTEKEAKLFVWDPTNRKKTFEVVPVPGAKTITALLNGPDGLLWGYAAGTLFKFDVQKKKVISTKPIIEDNRNTFLWRPDAMILHPNGMIYGALNGALIVMDPNTLEVKKIGQSGADLILGLDREMYYRSGKEIHRLDVLAK